MATSAGFKTTWCTRRGAEKVFSGTGINTILHYAAAHYGDAGDHSGGSAHEEDEEDEEEDEEGRGEVLGLCVFGYT